MITKIQNDLEAQVHRFANDWLTAAERTACATDIKFLKGEILRSKGRLRARDRLSKANQ